MKKSKRTIVSIILDETGSMQSCKQATISGFNEYLKTLKKIKNQTLLTLTKFNSSKTEIVYKNKGLKDVPELNDQGYMPDQLTPLYDAIGKTLNSLKKEVKKGDRIISVIITDGEENASIEYKRDDMFTLIKELEKKGWNFVFLNANQDSWQKRDFVGYAFQGSGLGGNGVASTMTFGANPVGVTAAFQAMGNVTTATASGDAKLVRVVVNALTNADGSLKQ